MVKSSDCSNALKMMGFRPSLSAAFGCREDDDDDDEEEDYVEEEEDDADATDANDISAEWTVSFQRASSPIRPATMALGALRFGQPEETSDDRQPEYAVREKLEGDRLWKHGTGSMKIW